MGNPAIVVNYTDWQLVDINPGSGVSLGDQVTLTILASGCPLGGHYGKVWVDGVGTVIPGITVEGTATTQVNAGNNITYTLKYTNGGSASATNVVITFTIPTGTTYQGINPSGATCTTPSVGATGTVTCTLTTVPAGGSGGDHRVG